MRTGGEKKEAGLAFVRLLAEPSRRRRLLLLTAALTLLAGGQTGAARLKIICLSRTLLALRFSRSCARVPGNRPQLFKGEATSAFHTIVCVCVSKLAAELSHKR